jgi:hypothetical protein
LEGRSYERIELTKGYPARGDQTQRRRYRHAAYS